ncbi:hypothetical protein JTE90_006646 [Oedothorax gibbosus]|uniref:Uncharacterized protein n=1 Tax=Oedothorax gibbosus TaxID=931172 RepID=A0AAV6TNZ5_9ARAC|nr:hypothetical protein JTE90_006646 [Oedothorax gibbosus]
MNWRRFPQGTWNPLPPMTLSTKNFGETPKGHSTRCARGGERRKRVDVIMNGLGLVFWPSIPENQNGSSTQMSEGHVTANLAALQQVTELLLPHASRTSGSPTRSGGCVIPINDIRGMTDLDTQRREGPESQAGSCLQAHRLYGWAGRACLII